MFWLAENRPLSCNFLLWPSKTIGTPWLVMASSASCSHTISLISVTQRLLSVSFLFRTTGKEGNEKGKFWLPSPISSHLLRIWTRYKHSPWQRCINSKQFWGFPAKLWCKKTKDISTISPSSPLTTSPFRIKPSLPSLCPHFFCQRLSLKESKKMICCPLIIGRYGRIQCPKSRD